MYILSSTYFGPVQWYSKLASGQPCIIDTHEHYVKQTYRNRCIIATTAGTQALTVPIERAGTGKCAVVDIRISDHGQWRHLHWNALVSAYGESPFFEFYADDLRPFFEKRWEWLADYNEAITHTLCDLLGIEPSISHTEAYADAEALGACDLREAIQPKHPAEDNAFTPRPYYQVYAAKHGFQPNLSILDLLFNEGPEAPLYLIG